MLIARMAGTAKENLFLIYRKHFSLGFFFDEIAIKVQKYNSNKTYPWV